MSIFVTRYERGQGPQLHVHPYPEVFVVETGTARFTAGFERAADETLRLVSVHPNGEVIQTDL